MFAEKELHVINHLLTLALQNRKLRDNPDKISDETAELANQIINKIIWGERAAAVATAHPYGDSDNGILVSGEPASNCQYRE
ncbi:hypothetical protein [Brevibacillus sp. MER 51]|uniref:hypothetical protein n=1 Tax=Brevibacillus sp. MER 51 TaxID=2939560 RepID=UPI00203ECBB3|nr:hypothetical protein [Brevibacillus sp. MER 51]MCM3143083.1 hypothetical protein [Brevibacillus sp. MER 51]